MSMEALNQIKAAEKEAEEIRQKAQREARDIVNGVKEAMVAENRQSMAFIREAAQKLADAQKIKTQDEIRALEVRRAAERRKVREEAEKRVSQTGEILFERIVANGDR